MNSNKAIICNVNPKVGDEGYLIEYVGGGIETRFELQKERPFTEPGGFYKSEGFLGSYNNRARYSHGKVRLTLVKRSKFNRWFIRYETLPANSN